MTTVGLSEAAWVAYPSRRRRPLKLGGGCSMKAWRNTLLSSLGGILMRRWPTTSSAAGMTEPMLSLVFADTVTMGAYGANLKLLVRTVRQCAGLRSAGSTRSILL